MSEYGGQLIIRPDLLTDEQATSAAGEAEVNYERGTGLPATAPRAHVFDIVAPSEEEYPAKFERLAEALRPYVDLRKCHKLGAGAVTHI